MFLGFIPAFCVSFCLSALLKTQVKYLFFFSLLFSLEGALESDRAVAKKNALHTLTTSPLLEVRECFDKKREADMDSNQVVSAATE